MIIITNKVGWTFLAATVAFAHKHVFCSLCFFSDLGNNSIDLGNSITSSSDFQNIISKINFKSKTLQSHS